MVLQKIQIEFRTESRFLVFPLSFAFSGVPNS
jgi:hypothetical protein